MSVSRFQVAKVTGDNGSKDGEVSTEEIALNGYGETNGHGEDDDYNHENYENDENCDRATSSPVPFNHQSTMDYNNSHTVYDTKNLKSFRHYTREALPRVDHYRDINSVHGHMSRPTLDELHGCDMSSTFHDSQKRKDRKSLLSPDPGESAVKFGWVKGVLVRCLVNIWGVMLFLRLSWVVAQAGIGYAVLIVLFASLVTVITTLSMSAICTNGEVRGGGSYYMISRSLGPEFGGSIGVIFSIANAVAVAMYAIGFSETVSALLKENEITLFADEINNVRFIGCITVLLLLGIALIGTEWEAKTQIFLLFILLLAMANFVLGTFIPPNEQKKERGFNGYSLDQFVENFGPDFRGESFFSIFAIFFPAATGILAGANISGDLKDPQQAIPVGTMLGIVITSLSYMGFAILFGVTSEREVLSANGTLILFDGQKQGLHHNYNMMSLISLYAPLITAGTWAAALSSALASLISAPKVFQALCKDKLFPYIQYFGKGEGKNNEPRRGYILAFLIALAGCALGDLNVIAPIISNFFLAAYCLINFSCFHASFAKSLGFRPSFRYYNMYVSLIGAILCLVVMFIINWAASLITFIICFALYFIVLYRKPDVNWGSSTQAATYRSALQTAYKLNLVPDHIKTYRPQILVLTGNAFARPPLVDLSYQLAKNIGLMICGHVVQARLNQKARENITHQNNDWLIKRKVKSFYTLSDDQSFVSGAKSMIQCTGIGKLRPNILMLGYKSDWQDCNKQELLEYFAVIHEAFDKHMALCILRLKKGLDHSRYGRLSHGDDVDEKTPKQSKADKKAEAKDIEKGESLLAAYDSVTSQTISGDSSDDESPLATTVIYDDQKSEHKSALVSGKDEEKSIMPKNILSTINQFQRKQKKSTIDVWWLYDDGGLTMLVPYILSTRKQWSGCKLRIFALANKKDDLNQEQRNMAALLNKFRIEYSDVTVISDIVRPPTEENRQKFNEMISKWRTKDLDEEPVKMNDSGNDGSGDFDGLNVLISESEYLALKNKSYRHIRLRELLLQHSMDASLIVMTLPMPRKGTCSAALYMAWLETLTADMPPFLFVRGNQTSVLTFYS